MATIVLTKRNECINKSFRIGHRGKSEYPLYLWFSSMGVQSLSTEPTLRIKGCTEGSSLRIDFMLDQNQGQILTLGFNQRSNHIQNGETFARRCDPPASTTLKRRVHTEGFPWIRENDLRSIDYREYSCSCSIEQIFIISSLNEFIDTTWQWFFSWKIMVTNLLLLGFHSCNSSYCSLNSRWQCSTYAQTKTAHDHLDFFSWLDVAHDGSGRQR